MPIITRWYIKSALVFFIAALVVRLLQTANSLWEYSSYVNALGPVYFHLFLVGWVTQLIFGVVFWMFPKYTLEKPRGSERLAWIIFWLLNVGLILRAVSEPIQGIQPSPIWGWLLALSAVLQWLAGLGFVANTWGRVKEK